MNNIAIRLATINDLPGILPLMHQLGYETDLSTLTVRFKNFTNQEGYGIAIADKDGEVIGWVAWSKSQLFVSDKVRIHIEGIVVKSEQKGTGIGKKLMNFVEERAHRCGGVIIDLTSGMRRAQDGSHKFYDALGYKNEGHMAKLYLRKELP